MPPSEQISFKPAFALMFAQHRVKHAPSGSEEFVIFDFSGVPLTVSDVKDGAQKIGKCFIRTKDPEVAPFLVERNHVTQKLAQHERILAFNGARRGHPQRMIVEVRHPEVVQQNAAVRVRVRAHATIALGRELGQFRHEAASFIE